MRCSYRGLLQYGCVDGVARLGHELPQHWLELGHRQHLGAGFEDRVVVRRTELLYLCEANVPPKLLTHVAVHADMMKEVVALKDALMLDHPQVGFADEGFQHCG